MNKTILFIKKYKIILLVTLLMIIILLLIIKLYQPKDDFTGGFGQPEPNTIIIKGWELKNKFNIPIGESLTIEQQQDITNHIQNDISKNHQANYFNAQIKNIQSQYDKKQGIDKTNFEIEIKNIKKYKISVDYTIPKINIK